MEQHKQIGDNDINIELTEKAKKDPKFVLYKNWLASNGVLWKDIDFPVAFGPAGFIGVAAEKDVPANSVIISVPNTLLVTTSKVKAGEMSGLIEANPDLFKDSDDADFNLLTIFLLRERIKGKDSFYYPMINVIDNSAILMHWKPEEIKELEDPYILKEAKEFEEEMDKTWDQFSAVFSKYPDLFPTEKVTKQDFFWCYEAVMTRCFGWSLPTTMLVPMADFLNHNADGTTHYIANVDFERNEEKAHKNYVQKKRKIDLAIFKDEALVLNEEDKGLFHVAATQRIDYIKKNIDYLSNEVKEKIESGNYRKLDLKKIVREINLSIIKKEKNMQVWDLPWFESSDEEDNDTEEEDGDGADDGKDTFDSLQKNEANKIKEKESTKKFADEETKEATIQPVKVEDNSAKDNEGDDESSEGDEEENDDTKEEREKYKYGKAVVTEKFSPTKYMKHNVSEYEKEEMNKIKKKNVISLEKGKDDDKEEEGEESEYEEEEDDSDWSWFSDSDKANYFLVATHNSLYYKKGDQIFNCYGRRTNRFLLMWYGFCIPENKYNSLSFRLWMNKSTLSNANPPKKILFKDYISGKEWGDNAIEGEEKSSPEELTKEFRVKMGSLCEDVLAYLRAQLLLTYKGTDLQRILVTIPTSIPYEEFVIGYAISMFIEIKNQFKTSIYQDEEILKDQSLDFRKRFAVVYRVEQKKIADLQIKLLNILLNITDKLKAGVSFKDAYMQKLPDLEKTDDEFIENRRRIAKYLKLFYNNYSI